MDWVEEGLFEFLEVDGYRLTRIGCGGVIISLAVILSGLEVKIGQRVYSNGGFGMPKGTLGLVVKINVPFENGRSTDVVAVHFEGDYTPTHMKFHELNFSQQGA